MSPNSMTQPLANIPGRKRLHRPRQRCQCCGNCYVLRICSESRRVWSLSWRGGWSWIKGRCSVRFLSYTIPLRKSSQDKAAWVFLLGLAFLAGTKCADKNLESFELKGNRKIHCRSCHLDGERRLLRRGTVTRSNIYLDTARTSKLARYSYFPLPRTSFLQWTSFESSSRVGGPTTTNSNKSKAGCTCMGCSARAPSISGDFHVVHALCQFHNSAGEMSLPDFVTGTPQLNVQRYNP